MGDGTPQAHTGLETPQTQRYEGRLASLTRACRARAPKAVADARSYFACNRTRLRYAKFRSMDLQFGSGSLERLKIAAAPGSIDAARNLAKARAACLSHQVNLAFPLHPHLAC